MSEQLNAKYEYKGEGELLSDISSSEPLVFVCENCGKEYKTKKGHDNHIKGCKPVVVEESVEIVEDVNYNVDKVIDAVKKSPISIEIVTKVVEVKQEPTQKDIYISMIMENRPFILKLNGTIIFDSEKENVMLLSFEDTHFRIGTNKYTYEGFNFKFKK